MREPPARVKFFGNPVVAVPVIGLCGLGLYAWSQNPDALLLGVPAFIGMVWTGKACQAMTKYREWRKAWDSMAEPQPRRTSVMPRLVSGLIAALVVGAFVASEGGVAPGAPQALAGILVLGVLIAVSAVAIRALAKRLRSRKARNALSGKRDCVTVVVARPILPVPTLEDAYKALPKHCWRAMNAPRQ